MTSEHALYMPTSQKCLGGATPDFLFSSGGVATWWSLSHQLQRMAGRARGMPKLQRCRKTKETHAALTRFLTNSVLLISKTHTAYRQVTAVCNPKHRKSQNLLRDQRYSVHLLLAEQHWKYSTRMIKAQCRLTWVEKWGTTCDGRTCAPVPVHASRRGPLLVGTRI